MDTEAHKGKQNQMIAIIIIINNNNTVISPLNAAVGIVTSFVLSIQSF